MSAIHTRIAAVIMTLCVCLPAIAGEGGSENASPASNSIFYNVPGPDMAVRPLGVGEYLFVTGSAMHPRDTSTSATYHGAGCIATDGHVNTDLQLPTGSAVHGIRVYYLNDSVNSGGLTSWLTYYDGQGSTTDAVNAVPTMVSGYGSEYFAFSTSLVIDNVSHGYALITNIGPSNVYICGIRVFMDTP